MANRTSVPYPRFSARDRRDDTPLSGGKLYTYEVGTTTPKAAYSDPDFTVPLTNPVILDANGEETIYFSGAYKMVLDRSDDTNEWTLDNYEISDPTTDMDYGIDVGAAYAYEVNGIDASSYSAGLTVKFRAGADNTGASTINVNGLGVKNILNPDGSALAASQINANGVYTIIYDGVAFQMQITNSMPTQPADTNNTKIANTAFVQQEILNAGVTMVYTKETFTSSGTFTVPTGIDAVWVTLLGGGGGGNGGASTLGGGGGASGGAIYQQLVDVSGQGGSVSVTIGAGGAGGAGLTAGTDGGDTTFGSLLLAEGGPGGPAGGGSSSAAKVRRVPAASILVGGDYSIGGTAGRTPNPGDAGDGGINLLSKDQPIGPDQSANSNGVTATVGTHGNGVGGSGASSNGSATTGGAGSIGICFVEYVLTTLS
jgi:hypothetical protein